MVAWLCGEVEWSGGVVGVRVRWAGVVVCGETTFGGKIISFPGGGFGFGFGFGDCCYCAYLLRSHTDNLSVERVR